MFVLIPLIIIFLSIAYINLNENISIYLEIFLYILMIAVTTLSVILYKNIQINLKEQENNKIRLEIYQLKQKLINCTNEKLINSIKHKIKSRQNELI